MNVFEIEEVHKLLLKLRTLINLNNTRYKRFSTSDNITRSFFSSFIHVNVCTSSGTDNVQSVFNLSMYAPAFTRWHVQMHWELCLQARILNAFEHVIMQMQESTWRENKYRVDVICASIGCMHTLTYMNEETNLWVIL